MFHYEILFQAVNCFSLYCLFLYYKINKYTRARLKTNVIRHDRNAGLGLDNFLAVTEYAAETYLLAETEITIPPSLTE